MSLCHQTHLFKGPWDHTFLLLLGFPGLSILLRPAPKLPHSRILSPHPPPGCWLVIHRTTLVSRCSSQTFSP